MYVDDIILTENDKEELLRLKGHLAQEFEIKDPGNLRYFLGMEVASSKGYCCFPKEVHLRFTEGDWYAWVQTY